ncbi:hypothetical protein FQA39_LY12848 [Lamprigera yunnana]|nr:hypothetical protein FQA39_LY12848 [Lamprigera yunnana]
MEVRFFEFLPNYQITKLANGKINNSDVTAYYSTVTGLYQSMPNQAYTYEINNSDIKTYMESLKDIDKSTLIQKMPPVTADTNELLLENEIIFDSIIVEINLNDGFNHEESEISQYLIDNLTKDNIVVTNLQDDNFVNSLKEKTDIYTEEATNVNLDRISFFQEKEQNLFKILKAIKTTRKIEEIQSHEIKEYYPVDDNNEVINEIANKVSFELFKEVNENFIVKFQTPNNIPSDKYLEHLCNLSLNKFFEKVKKTSVDYKYVQD